MKELPTRLRQYRASVTPNSGCWHGSDCITQAAAEIERLHGLLIEAEGMLCDPQGGPAANELAERIRAKTSEDATT